VAGCVIEGELGRGAMGAVFRARDPAGRAVALKVMLSQGSSRQRLERFRREVELTQGLSHPGIVRVLGGGVEGELPCLILELVEGSDLEEVFNDPGADPDTKLRLVEEVARAVDYAHGQGVVHRDLKPANVLVSSDGRARVTDFGLARDLDRKTRLTVTGQGLGTPAYMSPEQVMGDKNTGPGVDVYALGVMLFEALTGELPFDASTPMALYDSILKTKAPRPSSISPQAAPYDRLVESALAKDPARRLASAGAFARELEALRLGLAPQRGGPWPWIALAGLLLGAAGLAWGSVAPRALAPTPASTPPLSPQPALAATPTSAVRPSTEVLDEAGRLLEEGRPEQALALLRERELRESPLARRLATHLAGCARARDALAKLAAYTPADYSKVPDWLNEAEAALRDAEPDLERSPRALLLTARLANCRLDGTAVMAAFKKLMNVPCANERAESYECLLLSAETAATVNNRSLEVESLRRAVRLRPGRPEARVRLVYRASGTQDGGGALLSSLIREFPEDPDVLNIQASELFRLNAKRPKGDPKRAEALSRAETLMRKAISQREDPGKLVGLGFILMLQGRIADAKAAQLRGLQIGRERGLTGYWYRKGYLARRAFEQNKDKAALRTARMYLLRASARDSENPAVRGELAILRWVVGPRKPGKPGYREVRKSLQEANDRCPVDWEVNFYLGHALRFSSKHQAAAIRAFNRALEFKPGHPWSYLGRGMTYLGQGKRDLAAADARKALELKPGWQSAKDLLAQTGR
jgi:tetratricopeptide (TPR) repeat protein